MNKTGVRLLKGASNLFFILTFILWGILKRWQIPSASLYLYSQSYHHTQQMRYYAIIGNISKVGLLLPLLISVSTKLLADYFEARNLFGKDHPFIQPYRGLIYFKLSLVVIFTNITLFLLFSGSPLSESYILFFMITYISYYLVHSLGDRLYHRVEEKINTYKEPNDLTDVSLEAPKLPTGFSKVFFYILLMLTIIPLSLTGKYLTAVKEFYPHELILKPGVTTLTSKNNQCTVASRLFCHGNIVLNDTYSIKQIRVELNEDVAIELQDGRYEVRIQLTLDEYSIKEYTIEQDNGYYLIFNTDQLTKTNDSVFFTSIYILLIRPLMRK